MDESLQELENELKRLQPRRGSEELRARLERELGAPARPRFATATTLTSWKWLSRQMAAAAAVALTVSLAVWRWQRSSVDHPTAPEIVAHTEPVAAQLAPSDATVTPVASTPNSYRPVGVANVLYDLKEDGTVYLDNDTPARRVRYRYVDTYTWKNPATHASLKWSVPRDEVRVIPASLH